MGVYTVSLSPSQCADRSARLHLRVVHERGGVAIFEHVVGSAEAFLDVAALASDGLALHCCGIERQVALRPDLQRAGLERLFRFQHERQHLVFHRDQPQRLFGGVPIGRRNRRHRIADEAHRIVERVAALLGDLLDVVVVLHAARDRSRAPHEPGSSRA